MNDDGRISQLERDVRKLRRLVTALSALLVSGLLVAATPVGDYLKGKVLTIQDKSGRTRAEFYTATPQQTPGIMFKNAIGTNRLFVGLAINDEPLIQFYNASGDPCFFMNMQGKGQGEPEIKRKKEGDLGGIIWPAGNKVFYLNDTEDDYFHEPDCVALTNSQPMRRDIDWFKKNGKKPCPDCLIRMYRNK